MRRDDDVRQREQRRRGERLLLEHVERGAARRAPTRAPSTSASVSTRSPRAAFTIRTPGRISASRSASIRWRVSAVERQVQRDPVGLRAAASSSGAAARRARGSARAETNGSYATTRMPNARARAATSWPMRPKPMMRERLVGQLDAAEAAALPAPCDQRGVGLRDVARQREHQRDRVLGGRRACSTAARCRPGCRAPWRPRRRRCRPRCRPARSRAAASARRDQLGVDLRGGADDSAS